MSSRKEEERNEKIIRGLMKLPPNRRCINCDSLGPQYVCTNFWTFICITCSGIHREFTHRVKSVSMAKFTTQEVEALQRGGNQRAREIFMKDWDPQSMRLADSSNADKIREFIKKVYVDKKCAGGRSFDKPPRDMQSLQSHEDHRRASSYHSFSQSPPYEHQYEDRRYGKQTGMLTRKPGSDRGHYEGKVSSFLYSPGHPGEPTYEEKFVNENCTSRISDSSVSSTGDPFRFDGQSSNFQDSVYSSPPLQQVRDILIEDARAQTSNAYSEPKAKSDSDGLPCSQRTATSGNVGSFDGKSVSANPGSLIDFVLGPEESSGTQLAKTSVFPTSHLSTSAHSVNQDLFSLTTVQQRTASLAPPMDMFADISHQALSTIPSEQKTLAAPFSENVGWATFDLPQHPRPAADTNKVLPSMVPLTEQVTGNTNGITSMHNNWHPVQNSSTHIPFPVTDDQWHVVSHEIKRSAGQDNSTPWNAFDDATESISQTSFGALPTLQQNNETPILVKDITAYNGFQKSCVDDTTVGLNLPFNGVTGSLFPPVLPQAVGTQERRSTNPFDLPFGLDPEVSNGFLDMGSFEEALSNPQLPTTFLGGLSQPWFPHNSLPTCNPSLSQGNLAYIAGKAQSSHLPDLLPSQGPVASHGGNPFA